MAVLGDGLVVEAAPAADLVVQLAVARRDPEHVLEVLEQGRGRLRVLRVAEVVRHADPQ
jgi:hypothetical protein